jgi:hypothetical protein
MRCEGALFRTSLSFSTGPLPTWLSPSDHTVGGRWRCLVDGIPSDIQPPDSLLAAPEVSSDDAYCPPFLSGRFSLRGTHRPHRWSAAPLLC